MRLLLCLLAVFAVHASEPPPAEIREWKQRADGFETTTVSGSPLCRYGSDLIHLVRINPKLWQFTAHHYSTLPGAQRLTAEAWRDHLKASIVINAGQYTDDFTHLGILYCSGKHFGTRQHRIWNGIFLAEPYDPVYALVRTIDLLEHPDFKVEGMYAQAVQTMMLVDSTGAIRVNHTDKQARRSVIAEDKSGNILCLVTEGDYTLWDLGSWITASNLDIIRALALDGGAQAQLAIQINSEKITIPQHQIVLPGVISVQPRKW